MKKDFLVRDFECKMKYLSVLKDKNITYIPWNGHRIEEIKEKVSEKRFVNHNISVDFDKDGKLLGIEIVNDGDS